MNTKWSKRSKQKQLFEDCENERCVWKGRRRRRREKIGTKRVGERREREKVSRKREKKRKTIAGEKVCMKESIHSLIVSCLFLHGKNGTEKQESR